MKIFNWVHRRFHHKYEVGQDVKKAEFTRNGKDNLALLENVGIDSAFSDWKEGIFAIGTFGFDPALWKDFEHEHDSYLCEFGGKELCADDEDNGGEQEEEEIKFPLVLKACKHGFFHDQKDDDDHAQCDAIPKPIDFEDGVQNTYDQVKVANKKAGERITLADLFWADSEKNLLKTNKLTDEDQVQVHYNPTESNTKPTSYDDSVALISKKKLRKDHEARPMKKINQMVKKMLKKKIHPEVESQKDSTSRLKPIRLSESVKNA